jgi:hypothetical protein
VGTPTALHGSQRHARPKAAASHSTLAWVVVGRCGILGTVSTGTRIGSVPAQRSKVLAAGAALAIGGSYIAVSLATRAVGAWLLHDRRWQTLVVSHSA